jgi:putative DNA methylase
MQKAFIETQFPIARLSAESYKERKAVSGQTLTGLGKWWGRKPLILVRACILGMLMPASNNPKKDREIFLKILTMDDDGTWQRQKGDIPVKAWREAAPSEIQDKYFGARGFQRSISDEEKEFVLAQIWEGLTDQQRDCLDAQRKRPIPDRSKFDSLPYIERISECERPENVIGPLPAAWQEINAHLGTTAASLPELVEQLGHRLFGHDPHIGDAFCGGGSIPFEAARIGCRSYASDLNPVAGLLTWASLFLLPAGKDIERDVIKRQESAFRAADRSITELGIEHNEHGERADAFLYCTEVKPQGSDYYIPLAPSWIVDEFSRVIVDWRKEADSDRLTPNIVHASASVFATLKSNLVATLLTGKKSNTRVIDPFNPNRSWSVEGLRGPSGLRLWCNDDVVPRPDDIFQERLYCIRWVNERGDRRYAAPNSADLGSLWKIQANCAKIPV